MVYSRPLFEERIPPMDELRLQSTQASLAVAPRSGGRVSSLVVDDRELLVTDHTLGDLAWGIYPMVPWAGRLAKGSFSHDATDYQMPVNLPPHSAHGIGFTSEWTIAGPQEIDLELPEPWPFGGRVRQRFELANDRLTITATITATETMPFMVGWHPWFRRDLSRGTAPAELDFGNAAMYELDEHAIPTGQLVEPPPGPWDNCFTALDVDPTIRWPGLLELELSSSCDHWVVYTEPIDSLCVEPQTHAPDEFNRKPTVLEAGDTRQVTFEMRWRRL